MGDTKIVLLQGVNLGARNRVPMRALREALSEAGYRGVRTYLQSGNVVLEAQLVGSRLAEDVGRVIRERFDLAVPVHALDADELRAIVEANPFPQVAAADPKRFQVTFVPSPADADVVRDLTRLADVEGELLAARGHALYAHHPSGIHSSKLAASLTAKRLGVDSATARNWSTVIALMEMADAL